MLVDIYKFTKTFFGMESPKTSVTRHLGEGVDPLVAIARTLSELLQKALGDEKKCNGDNRQASLRGKYSGFWSRLISAYHLYAATYLQPTLIHNKIKVRRLDRILA